MTEEVLSNVTNFLVLLLGGLVLVEAGLHGAESEGLLEHSFLFIFLVGKRNLVLLELLGAQSESLLKLSFFFSLSLSLLFGAAKLSLSLLLGAAELCLSLLFLAP